MKTAKLFFFILLASAGTFAQTVRPASITELRTITTGGVTITPRIANVIFL